MIQATARIIQDAVLEFAGPEGFVGHVGGDDFVAVVSPDASDNVAKRIVERFDAGIGEFYEPGDLERGHVEVEDRRGELQKTPLASISIGVAMTGKRKFSHYVEAVNIATEMKTFAKRKAGSSFAIDRRSDIDAPPETG